MMWRPVYWPFWGFGWATQRLIRDKQSFFFQNKDMGASKAANANIKTVGFAAQSSFTGQKNANEMKMPHLYIYLMAEFIAFNTRLFVFSEIVLAKCCVSASDWQQSGTGTGSEGQRVPAKTYWHQSVLSRTETGWVWFCSVLRRASIRSGWKTSFTEHYHHFYVRPQQNRVASKEASVKPCPALVSPARPYLCVSVYFQINRSSILSRRRSVRSPCTPILDLLCQ